MIVLEIREKPMKGGRKNLKRAVEEQSLTLQDGQSIMQVVSLRGSNLIEVFINLEVYILFSFEILILFYSLICNSVLGC